MTWKPTNRDKAVQAARVRVWCGGCDKFLVAEGSKCPGCGWTKNSKKRRIK